MIEDLFKYNYIESNPKIEKVADQIYKTKFLPLEACKYMIDLANSIDNWKNTNLGNYPANDLFVDRISLHLKDKIFQHCYSIAKQIPQWTINENVIAGNIIMVMYNTTSYNHLDLHVDDSIFSASVLLNDDFEGGLLKFPNQNFDNRNVKVGEIILYPSLLTHAHMVEPVTKGNKYSLVIWSDWS